MSDSDLFREGDHVRISDPLYPRGVVLPEFKTALNWTGDDKLYFVRSSSGIAVSPQQRKLTLISRKCRL